MRRRTPSRAAVVVLAVCSLALALPAAAGAAQFQGTTGQEHPVAMVIDDEGFVQLVLIDWTADCNHGLQLILPTRFDGPFNGSTPTSFAAEGGYIGKGRPTKLRFRVYVRISGSLVGERWVGDFSGRAAVLRRGERINRCRLDGTDWSAGPLVP